MDEGADRLALVEDRCDDTHAPAGGKRERPAAAVDEAAVLVAARELERRIAERAPQRVLQVGRLPALAQLDEQLSHGRPREAPVQDHGEEGDRECNRDEQAEPDPDHGGPRRERRHREAGGEDQQAHLADEEHRHELPPRHRRRRARTPREPGHDGECDRDGDRRLDLLEHRRE